jgi:NAD(P)-dependent dehydrogenase (short-subunit alcohol dehydrogenase family)
MGITTNEVVVITGGSKGIGFASAALFLEAGKRVSIWDTEKPEDDFLDKYNKRVEHEIYGIGVIQLEGRDILRSKLVSQILKLYSGSKDETNMKQNNYDCALIPKDQYNPL